MNQVVSDQVSIYEVALRDGIQRHSDWIPTSDKCQLIYKLQQAGLTQFELSSFVSPKAVPQLKDASDVLAYTRSSLPQIHNQSSVLVINQKGYQRALTAKAHGIALVLIPTQTLSYKNSRCSVSESITQCKQLLRQAYHDELNVRVYLSAAWVCPYEGKVKSEQVHALLDGVLPELNRFENHSRQLVLADTVGHAHPLEVQSLIQEVTQSWPVSQLAVHLHDTLAFGLANCTMAIHEGVRCIDTSIGGLGGCPFAPGAAGNIATEDVVLLLDRMGLNTQVDLEALEDSLAFAQEITQRHLGGRSRTGWRNRRIMTLN